MNRILIAFITMMLAVALPALAATPIPPGKWSFVWKDAKGRSDRPMRVYTYRPRACDTTCPMVIVLHGAKRDASAYRDYWELAADRHRFLVGAPVGEGELRQALSHRLVLLLGEKDNDPDDENLNQSDGAKKQGDTRVERGENFFKAATAAAGDLGVKFAWELIEVPDVAQDGQSMSRIAADTLYAKR